MGRLAVPPVGALRDPGLEGRLENALVDSPQSDHEDHPQSTETLGSSPGVSHASHFLIGQIHSGPETYLQLHPAQCQESARQ